MPTILIVDDSAFTRMFHSALLRRKGFDVIGAENGRDAVDKYAARRPDAVLLDVTMPVLDGLSALKEIRRLDPDARVAMVTAISQEGTVTDALRAGAHAVVSKPVAPERVVTLVQELLQ